MTTAFTNERKAIHCENTANGVVLSGEFQFSADNRICTMDGTVSDSGNRGTFLYLEQSESEISYSINASKSFYDTVKAAVDATIEDIHSAYDK